MNQQEKDFIPVPIVLLSLVALAIVCLSNCQRSEPDAVIVAQPQVIRAMPHRITEPTDKGEDHIANVGKKVKPSPSVPCPDCGMWVGPRNKLAGQLKKIGYVGGKER